MLHTSATSPLNNNFNFKIGLKIFNCLKQMKWNCILPNKTSTEHKIFSLTPREPNMKSIESNHQVWSLSNIFKRIKLNRKKLGWQKKSHDTITIRKCLNNVVAKCFSFFYKYCINIGVRIWWINMFYIWFFFLSKIMFRKKKLKAVW